MKNDLSPLTAHGKTPEPRSEHCSGAATSGSFEPTDPDGHAELALAGGKPVRTTRWPMYDNGDAFICADDEQAGIAAIQRRRYCRYDDRPFAQSEVGRFETELCRYFAAKHALACTSGTTAIALALLGLDLPVGAAVLCPAFTFAATPSAIRLAGLRPVFVECDEDLHLDLTDLRRKISSDVRAVVAVHMRGFAADVHAIRQITDPLGIVVIEDAVPALGARLRGELLGTLGVAGAFSTQSDKALNTGEGGFLISDATELFARATVYSGAYEQRMARHFAPHEPPASICDLNYPIFGWRMDEIRGALASSMLKRLNQRVALHRSNYAAVAEGLADVPAIALRRPVAEGALLGECVLFRVLDARSGAAARFAQALRAEGISARNIGDEADTNVRAFWNWRFCFPEVAAARRALPRTAAALAQTVDIPLSANLTPHDRADLVCAIRKVAHAFGSAKS